MSFDPLNQLSFCQAHKKLFGIYLDKEIVTIYIYIYIYISLSVIFIVATLLLSHINGHMVHLFPTISLLFLNLLLLINYVSYCYTSYNLSPSLLHFYLRTTFNLNITLPLSTTLPFYFGSSYPHSIIINLLLSLPFYIYFSTQKIYYSLFFTCFLDRKSVV